MALREGNWAIAADEQNGMGLFQRLQLLSGPVPAARFQLDLLLAHLLETGRAAYRHTSLNVDVLAQCPGHLDREGLDQLGRRGVASTPAAWSTASARKSQLARE